MKTTHWLRALAAAVTLATLLGLSPGAGAQSGDKAAAEALFQAGRDLMTAGKFPEACAKLEASQRLDAGLGTLLYLADCYEKASRLASAWATFREAESIAMSRSDQGRVEVAKQRYTALEPRLAKLWFKVASGNDPATDLKLNGRLIPRESWDVAIPVDSGDQAIEASAPGRKPWSTTVRVEGEAVSVPVEVPLLEAAPVEAANIAPPPSGGLVPGPADAPPPASAGGTQRTIGIIVGAAGVVGLGVGTFFGLRAKSKKDESLDHCPNDPNRCDSEGVSLRNSALKSASIATITMIGGGVLVAGGVVLYLTAPSGSSQAGGVRALHVSTAAGPDQARVILGGAF